MTEQVTTLLHGDLPAPYSLQRDTLTSALRSGTKLQMVAVDDIGWFGARVHRR